MIIQATAREIARQAIDAYVFFEAETDTEHAAERAIESLDLPDALPISHDAESADSLIRCNAALNTQLRARALQIAQLHTTIRAHEADNAALIARAIRQVQLLKESYDALLCAAYAHATDDRAAVAAAEAAARILAELEAMNG